MSVARAASAGTWSAIDIVLRQGVGFVVSIILARLLAPENFGLMALLTFFISLSIVFVQGGLSLALVQRQETTREQETAVFWTNLCAGILFALILVAIAPLVARFYGYPLMDPLMYVAAAQVVLSSLGAVQTSLLTRTLRFDQLTKTGILSSVGSGVLGVAAAMNGWGIWALALQVLSQTAISVAALWWVMDWRPTWRVRFASIRDLVGFGTHLSLSSILEVVYSQGFVLIIGKFYGARDLAYLSRATSINTLPTGIISAVIARTTLPLFAARYAEKDALLRGFRMSASLAMLLSVPLLAGMSVLADLIILVLLGDTWMPTAPVLTVAAASGVLLPLHVLNLQLLLAGGESRMFLRLEIQKKIAGVICFGIGCFYGIIGIAYANIAFTIIAFYINAAPTKALLGYGVAEQIADLRGVFAATLFMAAGVYGLRQVIDLPPLPLLAVLVAAGGAIYFAFGFALRLQSFTAALDLAKLVVNNRRTRVPESA